MSRLALLLALIALLAPLGVYAQDDKARVVELIAAANESYDGGDFRDALENYREVYDITEDPRVLYRIGLTYENLSNYQRAREHLELYLLAEPDSRVASKVRKKIENLRDLEAKLQAAVEVESTPTGADVWVDTTTGRPAGVTPVRIPVGPGTHTVVLRKEGFEQVTDTVDVEEGVTLQRSYELGGGAEAVAVAEPERVPEETPVGEPKVVEEPAVDASLAGTPTRVRVGPSIGISVVSWLAIGVGWGLIAFATTDTATGYQITFRGPGLANGGFFLGAGLIALGAYFLWIKDYTRELPDARAAHLDAVPRSPGVGVAIPF